MGEPPRPTFNAPDRPLLVRLADARHWVWATLAQIERFVLAFHESTERLSQSGNPDTDRKAAMEFVEAQFLLNAAGHADKATRRLRAATLSPELSKDIRDLRNLHEHWEQHRDSFASTDREKSRAGASFAERHPDAVPWNFRFGSDGHFISTLRLEELWDELCLANHTLSKLQADALSGTALALDFVSDNAPASEPFPQPPEGKVLAVAVLTQDLEFKPTP